MPEVTSFVLSPRLVFTLTELLEGRHFCSCLCPQSLGDAWLRADTQGMFTNWPISRQSQLLGTWESSVYSSHRGPHTIEAATPHCASHSGSAWDCLFSERATWFLPLKDAKSKTGKKKKKKVYLFVPMASISSINTIDGACSSATRNNSRTSLGPSPRYFWMSSEPTTLRKVADVWFATALANKVLPMLDWKTQKGKNPQVLF